MKEMTYICFYTDYLDALEPYSMEERGNLLTAMLQYAATGTEPVFTGNERFIWSLLRGQMERDMKVYEERCIRNQQNGKKGGRPSKKAGASADDADSDGEDDSAAEPLQDDEPEYAESDTEEETEGFSEDEYETEGFSNQVAETDRFFWKPKKAKEKEKEKKKENTNEKEIEKEIKKEKKEENAGAVFCADAPSFLSDALKQAAQVYLDKIAAGTANEVDIQMLHIIRGDPCLLIPLQDSS